MSGGGTRNRSSIALGTTTTFSGGTLKKCRMSRFDASDTVMIRCARRAAAHITEARRRVGGKHLERLRGGIPADLPVLYVPELFTKATGRRVVTLVAEALAEELDVA